MAQRATTAKQRFGARSVLALESDDLALANYSAIGEALIACLRGRADAPDHILLFETDRGFLWQLFIVKRDYELYPDVQDRSSFTVAPN